MSLDELYREVILDHFRNPRNQGYVEVANVDLHMLNPTCGDEIRLSVQLDGEVLKDIRFTGKGCSISMASASMMTEVVKGQPVDRALRLAAAFKAMMRGEQANEDLGELQVLEGVAQFPVRIKCATLAWETLRKGLADGAAPSGADRSR